MPPARDRTQQALRRLPVAFLFTDREGMVVEATDRVGEILGCEPAALVSTSVFGLFSDAIRGPLREALGRMDGDGGSRLEGRQLRLEVRSPAGEPVDTGVQIRRHDDGFAIELLDARSSGEGLRAALLDAGSEPVVSAEGLAGVAAQVGSAFDWDLVAVWAIDDSSAALRAVAIWERDPDRARRYRSVTMRQPFLVGEGLPGRAWEGGEPLTVRHVDTDPRFGPGYGSNRRPQSGALLPLRVGRRTVGVLEMLTHAEVDPTLWLASEADSISAGLGHLVERFRVQVQAESVEGRLALALAAGELGVWNLDVRSGRAKWSTRMAELHSVRSTAGGAASVFASLHPDDTAAVGQVLERARGTDEPQTVEYRVRDIDRGTTWVSTRVTRVRMDGGPPTLTAVSAEITESKRAELSLQRRRAAVEGLQWVSQAIIAGRELTDTAMAVAHAATGVLGAEIGVVIYEQPGDVRSELAWAVSGLPGGAPPGEPPRGLDISSVARSTPAGVDLVPDLRAAPATTAVIRSLGLPVDVDVDSLRSAMVVPVGGEHGRPRGLMVFGHRDPSYFTEDDARLAASIGSITGVAIENARRHEEQRLAALLFQRQLLPREDVDIEGAESCIRYHPGRDGLDVGGDWYDVIRLGEHRVGLAVGDVCGHGLLAASHMGQFRYSFRALISASAGPEEAFQVLNRLALDDLGTTATVAYVELDLRTGACATWCCGHLPPIIASADGDAVRFVSGEATVCPMLGFVDELSVSPVRTTLEPGELLLLYTDGLVERRGESIDEGLARLQAGFAGRSGDLGRLCEELYRELAVTGSDADDTVLVALRRT
jgi:GAF domain-containing protein